MKLFRMFGRSIRDAFKSVFRNFSLSLASIACITITLIIVGVSILGSLNVNNFALEIEKDVTITIFLASDTNEEQRQNIENEFKNISNIDQESIIFKSKAEEKNEMMKESEIFNSVMSSWTEEENPLKDSYMLKVKDIEQINDTAKKIKNIEKVEIVNYGEDMVNSLVSAFRTIEKISVGIVLALILVTIFLIVNTIKLTIFSRKREISIMRLVGASNTSIKTPFIIEGLIIGFLGAIIPVLIIIYGYTMLYNHFGGVLYSNLIKLIFPTPFIYIVSAVVILIGMLVGMIGSAQAVRKYLKI